ncbi:MAG: hypothetical protein ACFCUG_13560 [Thiotrichales bacterium]
MHIGKNLPRATTTILLAAAHLSLLTACGGGGGEASKSSFSIIEAASASILPSGAVDAPSATSEKNINSVVAGKTGITSQNALQVADLALGFSQLPRYIETDYSGSVVVAHANEYVALNPRAALSEPTVVSGERVSCGAGGSVNISRSSVNTMPTINPQPGDQATYDLVQCKLGSTDIGTLLLNGSINAFLTEYTGDVINGGAGHAGLGLVLNNLQIGAEFYPSGKRTYANYHGEMALTADTTATSITVAASASRLSATLTEDTLTQYGATLFNYKSKLEQNLVNRTFNLTTAFRIQVASDSSGATGGIYTVSTEAPLVGTAIGGAHWPASSGKLRIAAADGSSVTLTAMSGGMVELAVDENGDGVAENTQIAHWENLVD